MTRNGALARSAKIPLPVLRLGKSCKLQAEINAACLRFLSRYSVAASRASSNSSHARSVAGRHSSCHPRAGTCHIRLVLRSAKQDPAETSTPNERPRQTPFSPPGALMTQKIPNIQLRAWRDSSHLTRVEMADALNRTDTGQQARLSCDEKRLARWETGEVLWPHAIYRRALQELTGRDAEDLGFIPPHRRGERPLLVGAVVPRDALQAEAEIFDTLELARLAVAVITGRAPANVVRLGGLEAVPGLIVLGHYGWQRWQDGQLTEPEPGPAVEAARAALPGLLRDAGAPEGTSIEDKTHALAVPTRRTADPEAALRGLRDPLGELAGRLGG